MRKLTVAGALLRYEEAVRRSAPFLERVILLRAYEQALDVALTTLVRGSEVPSA